MKTPPDSETPDEWSIDLVTSVTTSSNDLGPCSAVPPTFARHYIHLSYRVLQTHFWCQSTLRESSRCGKMGRAAAKVKAGAGVDWFEWRDSGGLASGTRLKLGWAEKVETAEAEKGPYARGASASASLTPIPSRS